MHSVAILFHPQSDEKHTLKKRRKPLSLFFCCVWNFHWKYGRSRDRHSNQKNRIKQQMITLLSVFQKVRSLQSYEQITYPNNFASNFHWKYGRSPNRHSNSKNRIKQQMITLLSVLKKAISLQSYKQITQPKFSTRFKTAYDVKFSRRL